MYTVETNNSKNENVVTEDFPTSADALNYAFKLVEEYGNMVEVKPYWEHSIARWQKFGDYSQRVYISVYPTNF